jgi:hypothetical protein
MTRDARRRNRPLPLLAVAALAFALALAGCGDVEDYNLEGELGDGTGGPAVNEDALVSHDLTNLALDTVIGTIAYDSTAFVHYHPDPEDESLHVIANIAPEQIIADFLDDGVLNDFSGDDIAIFVTPIIGRADTPCRFQAAVLARDENYKIKGSGDRKTNTGQELHQVNLAKASIPLTQRFYCYELIGEFGAQLNVVAVDDEHQDWRVVFAVLNSVVRE